MEPGTSIEAFKTLATWNDSTSGRRRKIEGSIVTASAALRTYIQHKLRPGSKLARIANDILARTERWYGIVHKFFDYDLQNLKDQGIPASKSLALVSEYVILIFDAHYSKMLSLVEFSLDTPRADWLVEVIWVNLEVLKEMEGITKGGDPKFNPTLAAAFIRFLTKTAAENSTAKLAGDIASIREELKKKDANDKKMREDIGRCVKK